MVFYLAVRNGSDQKCVCASGASEASVWHATARRGERRKDKEEKGPQNAADCGRACRPTVQTFRHYVPCTGRTLVAAALLGHVRLLPQSVQLLMCP